ncbi:SPFH domain-containing protein [Sphingomonas sp.]|uniref:SPFH domain-containing protein n=1 Tax=Sphingomonas sp. TaxID=28214 RepID=UPI003CC5414F
MSLFGFISKQLVDVIDWTEQPGDLALRYPIADREIQNGAQLTVRDGQIALFYDEGRVADAFQPGLHTLDTANLPMLTSLRHWETGFRSPYKADVYFFTTREHTGLKWGTPQPITVRDKEFGAIRIRAFGSYGFRIDDVPTFAGKLMGTLEHLSVADVEPQLKSVITTAIAAALGKGDTAFLDIAADQAAMSERLMAAVAPAFAQWGLKCTSFYVESVSLPENVQEYLDKGSQMRMVGDLNQYARFQAADSIDEAAAASGGVAGVGAGLAIGQNMAATLGSAFAQPTQASALASAPPAAAPAGPISSDDAFEQIEKLHKLLQMGALTQAEFDAKKASWLARMG